MGRYHFYSQLITAMLQLNFSPFPELTTGRLLLRQLIAADANAISELRSNATVNQYLDRAKTTSIAEAAQFIEKINDSISRNQSLYWVITLEENNHLLGTICMWNINTEEDTAEIGYELHPDHQGKGIMQEAMKAVIDFGFNVVQLKIITAFTLPENIASVRSLKRHGFILDTSGKYADPNEQGDSPYIIYELRK